MLVAVASGLASTRSTPGLPFGDVAIVAPTHLDAKPVIAFMPSPFALREEFYKRDLSGEASIGFTITEKGKPDGIKVLRTTNPEMAKLAVAYVSKMVFRPARLSGAAVPCKAELLFFDVPAA